MHRAPPGTRLPRHHIKHERTTGRRSAAASASPAPGIPGNAQPSQGRVIAPVNGHRRMADSRTAPAVGTSDRRHAAQRHAAVGRAAAGLAVGHADGRPAFDAWLDQPPHDRRRQPKAARPGRPRAAPVPRRRLRPVAAVAWRTRRPPPAGATTPAIAPTPSPAAVDPAELEGDGMIMTSRAEQSHRLRPKPDGVPRPRARPGTRWSRRARQRGLPDLRTRPTPRPLPRPRGSLAVE